MKTDTATVLKETRVDEHWFRLEDCNIISITINGDVDTAAAVKFTEVTEGFLQSAGQKLHMLIDLNKAGNASLEARHEGKARMADDRIAKIAYFGLHPVARMIAFFMIELARNNKMRFFGTEEAARQWLLK